MTQLSVLFAVFSHCLSPSLIHYLTSIPLPLYLSFFPILLLSYRLSLLCNINMDRDPTQSGPASQASQEPGSPSVLEDALKDLSAKSTLDMFRVFFDIKHEYWKAFRERLHQFVTTNSSWDIILKDVNQRRVCAEEFLQEVGVEYWGTPENREKYLEEKSIESGQVCIYPDDKRSSVLPHAS